MNRFKELFASMLKCILLLSQQSGSAQNSTKFKIQHKTSSLSSQLFKPSIFNFQQFIHILFKFFISSRLKHIYLILN